MKTQQKEFNKLKAAKESWPEEKIDELIKCYFTLRPHLFMIWFSVSVASDIFPFYSSVYVVDKYGIILKYNLIVNRGLLVSLTSSMKGGDT